MIKEINYKLLEELKNIPGHAVYHLEGSAWDHTLLVVEQAKLAFPNDPFFERLAWVHDIGKLWTAVVDEHGWASYPRHSVVGAERLSEVVPDDSDDFKRLRWFVRNHIKPLYWFEPGKDLEKEIAKIHIRIPGCTPELLARFAVCDLRGSWCIPEEKEKQEELQRKLLRIANKIGN